MLRTFEITSLDLPELAPYRTMKQQEDHRRLGVFVAEGEKVVRRLLASDLTVVSVLLPRKWLDELAPLLEGRRETIHAYVAEKAVLERLTGFSMYQGVLALGRIPASISLPEAWRRSSPPRFFAAVEALSNAENLGGLIRNCVAFGVQALLVGETSCSPYLRRAVRSSMGTVFQLPLIETPCLAASLAELRSAGMRCVAAHPHTREKNLHQADFRGEGCLVFGSEGHGLSREVLDACDEAVAIPMCSGVDSLNVGDSAAVFFYEVFRQRTARER